MDKFARTKSDSPVYGLLGNGAVIHQLPIPAEISEGYLDSTITVNRLSTFCLFLVDVCTFMRAAVDTNYILMRPYVEVFCTADSEVHWFERVQRVGH